MVPYSYFCILLGLIMCTIFSMWDFRLQSLLVDISQLHYYNQNSHTPHAFDQNSSAPRPRILCWVLTGTKNHMTKAIHVKRTWGSRCDKLLFMSSVEDPQLGTVALKGVEEGHKKLWPKTQKAFEYVWEHHRNDADWFMKADDDTFVIVDNLRSFLKEYDPNDPHFFGGIHRWGPDSPLLNLGGPGYVLSKEALKRFVEVALVKREDCFPGNRPDRKGDEDKEIALCLRSVGILPEKTTDQEGRNRFYVGNPFGAFTKMPENYEKEWNHGPRRFSNRTISYHYIKPHEMYTLEYLTHYLKTD